MKKFTLDKASAEEKKKLEVRMRSLLDFFEINQITPAEAVSMSMRFIAITCKGYFDDKELISMFRMMVKSVYKDEE